MKKIFSFIVFGLLILQTLICPQCKQTSQAKTAEIKSAKPKMAIVIDDFGSFDQSGVETLSKCTEKLTCAILPNVNNTEANKNQFEKLGHEIILHMPMQSHVNLPEDWYGPVYIKNYDSPETACKKLDDCLKQFKNV